MELNLVFAMKVLVSVRFKIHFPQQEMFLLTFSQDNLSGVTTLVQG